MNTGQNWWAGTIRARRFLLTLVVCVVAWHLIVEIFEVRSFIVPSPKQVLDEVLKNPAWLWMHTTQTLIATLAGFALAVVIGIVLAVAIVYSRFVEQTIYTALIALNSVPKVAIAPLFIIWVGTGMASKVTMAAVIALFAIVVDAVLGLRSVDPDVIDLAKSLGGRPVKILVKIRFPNALPSLFAGMKVAISLALIGTIVGEFVAASSGLGYVITTAQSTFDTARIFAALLVLALMGTGLFFIIDLFERWLMPWHVSHRSSEQIVAA